MLLSAFLYSNNAGEQRPGFAATKSAASDETTQPEGSTASATRQTKTTDPDTATAPVKEITSVTHHNVTIDGHAIGYEATAGTLTLRDDQGKPIASMFYVAYVADHENGDLKRPVTFFYNGGPGSASPWLHLGSFGPRVIQTDSPEGTQKTGITGTYIGALHAYLEKDLQYKTDLHYWPSGPEIIQHWDWHHKAPGTTAGAPTQTQPTVTLDLSAAMRENPHLRVFSLNGWYDMATPFFETEYDLKHMSLDPALRGNIRFAYYPSGHMIYLNRASFKQLKADVARFYDDVDIAVFFQSYI